jgi:tetratricopeptide (TPR) repeat protein
LPILTQTTRLPLLGPWLQHPLGVLALAAGEPALAVGSLTKALAARRAWTKSIHRHMGKAQLGLGRVDAAEQHLRLALSAAPLDRHNRLWLAETLLRRGRAVDAEALLRGLLSEGLDQRWLHLMLVHALLSQGQPDAAINHLIAAATRPGACLDQIPFPDYLLSSPIVTRERAEALAPVCERHPRQRELVTFQARLLARLGDHGPSARLLGRASGRADAECDPATAGSLKPPAFLIIGQAKAGTTALFDWLSRHPDIRSPLVKEILYWSLFRDASMDWYLAHFPPIPADTRRISGEASITYLTFPSAHTAIARDLPDVRLICLLREPVARAYSEYRMFVRLGWERRPWEQVVNDELTGLGDCPLDPATLEAVRGQSGRGYLLGSAALPHLQRFAALFPPSRLLILDSAALFADPDASVGRVVRYLGLREYRLGSVQPVNQGHYPPMAPPLRQRLDDWFAPHQQALDTFLKELHA